MTKNTLAPLSAIVSSSDQDLLSRWIELQTLDKSRSEGVSDSSIKTSSAEFLKLFQDAVKSNDLSAGNTPAWEPVYKMLGELSTSRALLGSTPRETANFVFSLKQVLFEKLNAEYASDGTELAKAIWTVSEMLDKLGLYTTEVFQKSRESVIRRQQKDIMEMSTPVIKMWEGILSVPLIGTLDSARTQMVMESLLEKIVETGSKIAILDITGVPTVDTQTAQHLLKTVSAIRLMGADCIISGIRPQIAQTIVHLGIEIYDISTKATMEDALRQALDQVGFVVTRESDNHKVR